MGANIGNSDCKKELISGAGIQIDKDQVPMQLADKVIPTLECNPKLFRRSNFIKYGSRSSTGTVTIVAAADVTKATFITGAWIGVSKNAANDTATGSIDIRIVQDGQTKDILGIPMTTLTAENVMATMSYPDPIKIDKNNAIITSTFTVGAGAGVLTAGVIGYTVESNND